MAWETWYVLDDGTYADPADVATSKSGFLMHKSGVPVKVGPHGPVSRGVDPDEERAKAKKPYNPATRSTKDMKPEAAKAPYTTRESKAE